MYDKAELKRLLSIDQYKVIDDAGKVLPPSHPVYTSISKAMADAGSVMSGKHVYTTIRNNRNDFYFFVKKTFLGDAEGHGGSDNHHSDSGSIDIPFSLPNNKETRKFSLVISYEKWTDIKPQKQDGKPLTLQKNKWTNVFADKIYEQHKIPCAFVFKNSKVFDGSSAKYYVKFRAKCVECSANLEGVASQKPKSKQDIIFYCKLTNLISNFSHCRKRQLRGDKRRELAAQLVDGRKSAALWRSERVDANISFGDDIPPTIPNTDVLRKAKQEEIDIRLGLTSSDPIMNLIVAKNTTHQGVIHSIGADPFFCIYWWPEQNMLHKTCFQSTKNIYHVADATGGVVFKIPLPFENTTKYSSVKEIKSKYIFLYQHMCVWRGEDETAKAKPKSCPLYQMLSARHDASFLTFFFSEIVRSKAPIPKIMVTDFSKALLIAVARAFASCSDLKDYLHKCFNYIVLRQKAELPTCCLRLDVSHFIAQIARWKCLKHQKPQVRQFYLRSLAHVYKMNDFSEVESALRSILVVALSHRTGINSSGETYSSTEHLHRVDNMIRGAPNVFEPTDKHMEEEDDEDEHKTELILDSDNDSTSTWIEWSKQLCQDAAKIANESTDDCGILNVNPFNIPSVAKAIQDLMYYLPLWTAIMYPGFGIDSAIRSSSAVEGQFSKTKTIGFDKLPLRADKFILKHLEWLRGELKLIAPLTLSTEAKQRLTERNKRKDGHLMGDSFNEEENWRGKVKKAKVVHFDSSEEDYLPTNVAPSKYDPSDHDDRSDDDSIVSCLSKPAKSFAVQNRKSNNDENHETRTFATIISNNDKSLSFKSQELFHSTAVSDVINIGESDNLPFTISDCAKDYRIEHKNTQDSGIYKVDNVNLEDSENLTFIIPQDSSNNHTKQNELNVIDDLLIPQVKAPGNYSQKNYLDDYPAWTSKLKSRTDQHILPLIPNGLSSPDLKIKAIKYYVSNTCAFDALVTLIMQGAKISQTFRLFLSTADVPTAKLALQILESGKIEKKHYKLRFDILYSVSFIEKLINTQKIVSLNAECNVAHLSEVLFESYPCYVVASTCKQCCHKNVFKQTFIPVNVNILFNLGYGSMQAAIDDVNKSQRGERPCQKCKSATSVLRKSGPYLIIDLSVSTCQLYRKEFPLEKRKQCTLGTVPKCLLFDDKEYILAGAIHYTSFTSKSGHYTAFVSSGEHWFKYDDLSTTVRKAPTATEIVPHLFMYVERNICLRSS